MERTINHQSKKGYSQKNKKEQSTCAKQKEKISCQTENKTNAMLLDVACTWEMKTKTKKLDYLPAMVGCPNVASLPCPQNNPWKEWKEQSTCMKKQKQSTNFFWMAWQKTLKPKTTINHCFFQMVMYKNMKQQLSNNKPVQRPAQVAERTIKLWKRKRKTSTTRQKTQPLLATPSCWCPMPHPKIIMNFWINKTKTKTTINQFFSWCGLTLEKRMAKQKQQYLSGKKGCSQ